MPTTNPVVSGLSAYIEQNREVLIKNFALVGSDTRSRIGIQTGIKTKEHLHYLDVAPTLQSGVACGFEAAGTITLSQREIQVAPIAIQMDWCEKLLAGKYAEYLVRWNAEGLKENSFEQYITEALNNEINKKIEKLIWQGDTTSASTDLKWINGFLKQMNTESASLAASVSITSGTSAYQGLFSVYMSMPDEAIERGGVIFVSPSIYRAFLADMVSLNFYHYAGPSEAFPKEFYLPGTDVKVIYTAGLAGSLKVVATFAENLVYGTDAMGDEEVYDMWYSQDDRVWKIDIEWVSGVAYHFPNMIVVGTFAAAPALVAPQAISVEAIGTPTQES